MIPKNCFKLNGGMEIVKQNNGAFMWACRIWKRFSSFQLRSIAIFCSCPCEACTCVYSIYLRFKDTIIGWKHTCSPTIIFTKPNVRPCEFNLFMISLFDKHCTDFTFTVWESSSYTSMNSRTASKTFMINMFEKSCKFGNFKYPWAPALLSNQFQTFGLL